MEWWYGHHVQYWNSHMHLSQDTKSNILLEEEEKLIAINAAEADRCSWETIVGIIYSREAKQKQFYGVSGMCPAVNWLLDIHHIIVCTVVLYVYLALSCWLVTMRTGMLNASK